MPFLDIDKKIWKIKSLEVPVKENVPMKELRWFKEKMKEAQKLQEDKTITPLQALEFDEAWWSKTCEIGLGKTKEDIEDTGVSEPEFRLLMAEVYHFLVTFGSLEEAGLSGYFAPKTKDSDSKP